MRTSVVAGITAALLTACSGGSVTPGNGVPTRGNVSQARAPWILPGASKQWLLYVSDLTNGTVDIYNYRVKTGKLYGQITGFTHPLGQCVDASGNVYVTDYRSQEIYEYAHGGTTPIAAAYDYYGRPNGCAFDSTTGNIAVTNTVTISEPGNLVVFSGGLSGTQTVISGSNLDLDTFDPPAYDPNGNLFFEASTYSTLGVLGELPAGGSTLMLLGGLTFIEPGSVGWDGSYIVAMDRNYENSGTTTALYRLAISGSSVTIVRTTLLRDDCSGYGGADVFQPLVASTTGKMNTVVGGNVAVGCSYRLDFWNYAKGGIPKRVMPSNISPEYPTGVALSPPSGASR